MIIHYIHIIGDYSRRLYLRSGVLVSSSDMRPQKKEALRQQAKRAIGMGGSKKSKAL